MPYSATLLPVGSRGGNVKNHASVKILILAVYFVSSLLTCNETVVLRVHPRHTF